MQLDRAAFELESLVQARARDGRGTEIEQVDCELGDQRTACVFVYFSGDPEPLMVLVDLESPMSETEFEAKRNALLLGLLALAPTPPAH